MRTLFSCALVLTLLGMATGCGSGSSAVKTASYPPPPAAVEMALKRTSGGDVNIDLTIKGVGADTSRQMSFVRNIQSVQTVLYHPVSGVLDTLVYSLASASGDNELAIDAMGRWTNSLGLAFDSLYTQTLITERGGAVYSFERGFSLPVKDDKHQAMLAMKVKGWVENPTDSSVVFVVLAERMRVLPDEFFPSSERLRVIITDEDGGTVWNSSIAQIFMQMTSPVDPKNVGEVKRYEQLWNGMDAEGKPVPPGHYQATLMVAARPAPYTVVIPFDWRVDYDK